MLRSLRRHRSFLEWLFILACLVLIVFAIRQFMPDSGFSQDLDKFFNVLAQGAGWIGDGLNRLAGILQQL